VQIGVAAGAGGAQPGRVTVAITDSGAGIAEADRARIFEPFFSTKASGTGLGLALVQQIVAEHGGQISVASPAEDDDSDGGPGTTFLLDFPALPPQAARATGGGRAAVGLSPAVALAPAAIAIPPGGKR
jgi:signal transduction histidine kinase